MKEYICKEDLQFPELELRVYNLIQLLPTVSKADIQQEIIGQVKSSLKQAGYEYDKNMNIGNNIGGALLQEYAKGYIKGSTSKISEKECDICREFGDKVVSLYSEFGGKGCMLREVVDLILAEMEQE